ncbi:hypothetical protein ACFFRR_003732 [Megaselia abdita]
MECNVIASEEKIEMSKALSTLQFCNISYQIKTGKEKKLIIDDVSGRLEAGRLGAILGPSGAGKTSLLNILSGFKHKDVSGSIFVDGRLRNVKGFRKMSTYISQTFPMLENLSVYETLQVSADLKLGTNVSPQAKSENIKNILKMVNLVKCSNTMVYSLSGGERKRLTIAVELVTNPPIMFFDEPTSGLDSVASLQIITHLRRLAQDGRIIYCVMHQPGSKLLQLFDDILVMADGKILYCGALTNMVNYFESEGFHFPDFYNPADFVLEVANRDYAADISSLINRNTETYQLLNTSYSSFDDDEEIEMLKSRRKSKAIEILPINSEPICDNYKVNAFYQFRVLAQRSFRAMWRDVLTVQLRVVIHLLVGFLLGVVFYDMGNDANKVLSNASFLFFCVLFIFFGNALPALLTCPLETSVFIREHLNGWYSITSYYFAKLVSDLPLLFICPTLLSVIAYYMTGQPEELGRFVMFWGMGLLNGLLGQSIGLVFGSAFKLQTGIFLIPGICIPVLLFSGFFIRKHELFSYLQPLTDISYFRYSLEGFIQSVYGYNRTNLECATTFCYYKSADKFLQDMDMAGDNYGLDVLAIILYIIALDILFYLSLFIGVKRAQ